MGAVNVGTLVAVLRADVSKWTPGMKKAGKSADLMGKKVDELRSSVLGLAASIGGAAVALTAMNWADQAAQALQARQVYEATGGSIEKLRKATLGMISDSELVKKANMASELGINEKAFADLARTAVASSKVMGLTMDEAFERIILGTAKMEKEILEETGIVFRADVAFRKYAKAHGVATASLDEAAKKQIYINEVIKRGAGIIDKANLATSKAADGFARMRTKIANVKEEIGTRLIPIMSQVGNTISDVIDWFQKMDEPLKRGILKAVQFGVALAAVGVGFIALATPMGQFLAVLGVIAFSIGLVASVFTDELKLMEKNGTIANANLKQIFKNGFLAILATVFTLSGGVALVMDTIAYGIIESLAGILMIFTVTIDTVKSFWTTLGSFIIDILKKVAGGINSLIQAAPGIPESIKTGAEAAVAALNAINLEKGLDLGLTKQVLDAKTEMQRTTFKFTPENTPQELAEMTMKGISGLMERSASGLSAFLSAIGGAGEDAAKKITAATKKANDEVKKAGIGKDGDLTITHVIKGSGGGTDPFQLFADMADMFGNGGVGGLISGGMDKAAGLVGGGIAAALGVAAPGVGDAIGQGLLSTAGQVGEVIGQVIEMTIVPLFDRLVAPILAAGSGRFSDATGAGAEAGVAGVLTAGLGVLAGIVAAVLTPAIVTLAVVLSPVIILVGGIVAGFMTLLAIVLAVPAAIGLMVGAAIGFAGFALQLATQSESFEKFGNALDFATDILVAAVEPIFEAFMPLAGIAIIVAEGMAAMIASLVQIEPVMRVVFEVVKFFGLALLGLTTILTHLTGGDVAAVSEAFAELQAATFETAGAMANAAVATNDAADAARSFSEELLNMAPGFNARLAISQASGASTGASLATGNMLRTGNARRGI